MPTDPLAEKTTPDAIEEWNSEAVLASSRSAGEVTLLVAPGRIRETCRFLKDELQFVRLSSVTAVDRYPATPRFEVVYPLHSLERNERIRLKCKLDEASPAIASVITVWRSADWYEREIFDLFGIVFLDHPNLKRLMMPDDWEGNPLRKDFPVHGYKYSYQDE